MLVLQKSSFTQKNVYFVGGHKWKSGTLIENLPHQLVCNNHIKSVSVIVEGKF